MYDYISNNHAVSTLIEAAQCIAGTNFFSRLDCSQAYRCLELVDQPSIDLLAFNFASGTFAHRRLAQGLNRSLSAFLRFVREYLDPVIKGDQCSQYVDVIGIAANTPKQLIKHLRAVFQFLRKACIKFSMAKCHLGVQKTVFSGLSKRAKGVAPQKTIHSQTSLKIKNSKSQKSNSTLYSFFELLP